MANDDLQHPPSDPSLPTGRLLGVDYGTVRVGFAISDPDRIIASPLATYTRRDENADAAHIVALVAAEHVVGLVVGLPLHTGGEAGIKAAEAVRFGAWLKSLTGLHVVFWDERCTTAAAEEALLASGLTRGKRKARRDRVAAQIILQSYLDAGCPVEGSLVSLN